MKVFHKNHREFRSKIRKVALIANREKARAVEVLPSLRTWLSNRKIKVLAPKQLAKADLALVLGGDGTILSIAPQAATARVPVLGINFGHLGFLTAADVNKLYQSLEQSFYGEWTVSERMMLEVRGARIKGRELALNDIVVRTGTTTRVTSIRAAVDDQNLGTFRGDGLIVATPTGSTAYSLSAKGPVVHPDFEALIVNPICPHSFTQRPMVLPVDRKLTLKISDERIRRDVALALDGQRTFNLKCGDILSVRKSPYKLKLVTDPKMPYFRVLREKMSWGDR